MSIIRALDENDFFKVLLNNREPECFKCGDLVSPPIICWSGATGFIYLHPNCVHQLAMRLYRDVWELQVGKNASPVPG